MPSRVLVHPVWRAEGDRQHHRVRHIPVTGGHGGLFLDLQWHPLQQLPRR